MFEHSVNRIYINSILWLYKLNNEKIIKAILLIVFVLLVIFNYFSKKQKYTYRKVYDIDIYTIM